MLPSHSEVSYFIVRLYHKWFVMKYKVLHFMNILIKTINSNSKFFWHIAITLQFFLWVGAERVIFSMCSLCKEGFCACKWHLLSISMWIINWHEVCSWEVFPVTQEIMFFTLAKEPEKAQSSFNISIWLLWAKQSKHMSLQWWVGELFEKR